MLMSGYATGINLALGRVGYRLLAAFMIVTYALTTDDPIKASTMFVIISYCQILSGSFMRFFPRAIQLAAEGHVAVNRIEVSLVLTHMLLKMCTCTFKCTFVILIHEILVIIILTATL